MPSRRRLNVLSDEFFPAYVVWELTLQCDMGCRHCGSRAGKARPDELTTAQALEVVDQLASMGAREVVLIGGEAYLHEGFLTIAAALRDAGVTPIMTTGGRGITAELAREMAQAGIERVSVSVDGMPETHDRMRARTGSFQDTVNAMGHIKAAGMKVMANTNFNRLNRADLEPLYEHLLAQGITTWQIQITTPLGRAADRTDMVFQPYDLLEFVPRVAALKQRAYAEGVLILPGNNLGYFGPEEALLRSARPGGTDHWHGCQAGRFVMGIESDGAVKGCPSLQTAHYVGGHLRERSLETIWNDSPELSFTRARGVDDLWGRCRSCVFAETCLGGCSFTAHAVFGRPGNNPYCHFRARTLAKEGKRERLVSVQAAPGLPFDNGRFDVVIESVDAPDVSYEPQRLVQITSRRAPPG